MMDNKYRDLKTGDIIRPGDQWFNIDWEVGGPWFEVDNGHRVVGLVYSESWKRMRRKLWEK
jgi:hypothetical protein